MLLVGWQEGHPACKSSATTIPNSLLLGTGLTWSDLEKNGPVKQKPIWLSRFLLMVVVVVVSIIPVIRRNTVIAVTELELRWQFVLERETLLARVCCVCPWYSLVLSSPVALRWGGSSDTAGFGHEHHQWTWLKLSMNVVSTVLQNC